MFNNLPDFKYLGRSLIVLFAFALIGLGTVLVVVSKFLLNHVHFVF